jgi:uncharacterized membrane-anchored protein
MIQATKDLLIKVPAVTLGFWIIKILCTTLGETGGDAVSMTWNLGYLVSTGIFIVILIGLIVAQVKSKTYKPWLYWATIIASTTAGTTLADFADRSLGVGYTGGSLILLTFLLATLFIWKKSTGTISVDSISNAKSEVFYWTAITFSQTLGTALGDWFADTNGLGYLHSAFVFGTLLLIITLLYFRTKVSKVLLFWGAFILTRPLGAVVGDFLDKPFAKGGLNISRPMISIILLVAIVILIAVTPQKAGEHPKNA